MVDPRDLLQEAMKLPPDARAALARSLLESLDAQVDSDAEAAWDAELERRIREIDQGTSKLMPWNKVCRRISR